MIKKFESNFSRNNLTMKKINKNKIIFFTINKPPKKDCLSGAIIQSFFENVKKFRTTKFYKIPQTNTEINIPTTSAINAGIIIPLVFFIFKQLV